MTWFQAQYEQLATRRDVIWRDAPDCRRDMRRLGASVQADLPRGDLKIVDELKARGIR